jgi:hypothetical protein
VKIVVLTQAKEDLFDDYLFYERQETVIVDYFLDSISADIDSLVLHHGIHRQFYGFHRMLARVFPFFIYYRSMDGTIYIDAVVDQRRNPSSINRLLFRLRKND